jgi:hypothetical protein
MAKGNVEEARAVISVGQYILDKVNEGAEKEKKKELKLKRDLWKFTGRR